MYGYFKPMTRETVIPLASSCHRKPRQVSQYCTHIAFHSLTGTSLTQSTYIKSNVQENAYIKALHAYHLDSLLSEFSTRYAVG